LLRVLVDIKHPAEANFFQPLLKRLRERGDSVLVTAHYKADVAEVLTALGIEHVVISRELRTRPGIVAAAALRTVRLLRLAARFRPQIMVARVGAEVGAVGRLLSVPTLSYDENEYATVQLAVSRRLASFICTGMGYEKSFGRKQLRFNAPPQLAYTHPKRFRPDRSRVAINGFDPDEPYVVVRLSRWQALHDIGYAGTTQGRLVRLIEALSRHARVLASRAGGLPPALQRYGHALPPDSVLHLLAFARLYVGEGGSMAAEAACLGTPAIYLSPLRWGYVNVLAKRYGLVEQTIDLEHAQERAERWLTDDALRERAKQAHKRLLQDSADPVEFMIDAVDRHARDT
jgi:predicted glycosyltransferase